MRDPGTDVFTLAAKLGMDPIELLRMINGKGVPTRQLSGVCRRSSTAMFSLLTKLAAEIKP